MAWQHLWGKTHLVNIWNRYIFLIQMKMSILLHVSNSYSYMSMKSEIIVSWAFVTGYVPFHIPNKHSRKGCDSCEIKRSNKRLIVQHSIVCRPFTNHPEYWHSLSQIVMKIN